MINHIKETIETQILVEYPGKKVKFHQEGRNLNEAQLDEEAFNVHLKAVLPFFTAEDNDKRKTAFEKNINVTSFYFDIPKVKKGDVDTMTIQRTTFSTIVPFPYIINSVTVSGQNIQANDVLPIENATQMILQQGNDVMQAVLLKIISNLRLKLHGSIFAAVNLGAPQIAKIFLQKKEADSNDSEQQKKLKEVLRKFVENVELGLAEFEKMMNPNTPGDLGFLQACKEEFPKWKENIMEYLG